jgi:hypothetical protein
MLIRTYERVLHSFTLSNTRSLKSLSLHNNDRFSRKVKEMDLAITSNKKE